MKDNTYLVAEHMVEIFLLVHEFIEQDLARFKPGTYSKKELDAVRHSMRETIITNLATEMIKCARTHKWTKKEQQTKGAS